MQPIDDYSFVAPVPAFIPPFPEEHFRELVTERLALINHHPNNSDFGMKLADVLVYLLSVSYILQAQLIKGCFVDYAEGVQLDSLVKLAGVIRKRATPPIAKAKITASENTFLTAGTQFMTSAGKLASLVSDATITPEGIEVVLESTEEGSIPIDRPASLLSTITKVEILTPFQRLSENEDDNQLRERFKKALARFSTAGSKQTYEYYALSVPGVKEATAYNNGAGKVLIVYDGKELLADVIQKSLKPVTPMTDSLTVKKATEVEVNAKITIVFNPDADVSYVQENIRELLQEAFAAVKIGEKIPRSKLYAYLTNRREVYSSDIDQDTLDKVEKTQAHSILKLKNITFNVQYRRING